MKYLLLVALLVAGLPHGTIVQTPDDKIRVLSTKKIWDQAPHNAFTDLVFFKGKWFCVFREGQGHVSPDGALRVICSADGETWESAARITADDADLRDAKINVTPGGQLMLCGAGAMHDYSIHKKKDAHSHESFVWFSEDGSNWSDRQRVGDLNNWLWRVTWHQGTAYGVGYKCGPDGVRGTNLYTSKTGKTFERFIENFQDDGYTNESSIVFAPDKTAFCLLRRDGAAGKNTGLWGVAGPPYKNWTWHDSGVRIGGPHLLQLPDGRFIAAVRLYDGGARTSLCWIEPDSGKLTEAVKLPSGGDTSYPGLVWKDELLWVSYYSSHDGKTSIYLSKVQID